VRLSESGAPTQFCTAKLLDEAQILTARHCTAPEDFFTLAVVVGPDSKNWKFIPIKTCHFPHEFNLQAPVPGKTYNDQSICFLKTPVIEFKRIKITGRRTFLAIKKVVALG
jgi:hypothetical protein